jgi:acyl-CoA thioesterase FadM
MNMWLRAIRVIIGSLFGKKLDTLGVSKVSFVVSPFDIDVNLHMNNGRYLTIMDLGRIDLMVRNGLGRVCIKRKWRPVVASATIRFFRPLPPFVRFTVATRLLGWDEQFFFIEQRFERNSKLASAAVVKGVLLGPGGGKVAPDEVAAAAGYEGDPPAIPAHVKAWMEWDKAAGA